MPKKTSIAMSTLDGARREVVLRHVRGASMSQIAREFEVSAPSVQKWLKREGFLYGKKGRYHEKMPENAKKLVRAGFSREQIAKALRCPLRVVEQWTQSEVQKNPRKKNKKDTPWPPPAHACRKHWTSEEKRFVLSLMERGYSPRRIYLRTRASKQRQRQIWREAGFKGRPTNFKKPVRFPVRGSALGVIGFRSALPELPKGPVRPPVQRTPPGQYVTIPPYREERRVLSGPRASDRLGSGRESSSVPDIRTGRSPRSIEGPLPRVTQISPPKEDEEN